MKSIMHDKNDRTCYLCMKLEDDYSTYPYLEEHHVAYGKGNRKLSERYGLKVYLCHRHHNDQFSPVAVHNNPEIRQELCEDAQRAFMAKYPDKSFRAIFGMNYLDPEEAEEIQESTGAEDVTRGIIEIRNEIRLPFGRRQ